MAISEPNPDRVITNPLSGERIIIRDSSAELLTWELFLAPGGKVPSSHAHPAQTERFTVVAGALRFRIGARSRLVTAGHSVAVPPGAVHHFANPGPDEAHVLVETRPALDMAALLRTAAALAQADHAAARRRPKPVELVLFMREFEHEVRAPYLPGIAVRAVTYTLSWLAARFGLDARYRRVRATVG